MLERNGLVKGNGSNSRRIVVTTMDDFEAEIRRRRRERNRKRKEIEDDYKKAQDYEAGKQT